MVELSDLLHLHQSAFRLHAPEARARSFFPAYSKIWEWYTIAAFSHYYLILKCLWHILAVP